VIHADLSKISVSREHDGMEVKWLRLVAVVVTAEAGIAMWARFAPAKSDQKQAQDQGAINASIPTIERIPSLPALDQITQNYIGKSKEIRETAVTKHMIATLEDSELDDRIWSRLLDRYSFDETSLATTPKEVRAYLATREFEWEVGNGGLFQYFHNYPSEQLLAHVIEGYSLLDLEEAQAALETVIWPIAKREAAWSATLEDENEFSKGYIESELPRYDHLVANHDAERIKFVRAHTKYFVG
jgi:Domain of unknown function (DUF4375)